MALNTLSADYVVLQAIGNTLITRVSWLNVGIPQSSIAKTS